MDITIIPNLLKGTVHAVPSKSQAHRFMICASFADQPTTIICPETNKDIEATAACLRAIGARITRISSGYTIHPVLHIPESADLPCGESGSTLRFLLPVVGALGISATFHMSGRLPTRPLSPLWEEMIRMGCNLSRPTDNTILCTGKLIPGKYNIDGNVSSQFITGLLLGLSLLSGKSKLNISGNTVSNPYIQMTYEAMNTFDLDVSSLGQRSFRSPGLLTVEGDWSNAAFFLGANAIGSSIKVVGLNPASSQGDRIVDELIDKLRLSFQTVDICDIPDLVPILSVVASANHGVRFLNIQRLRTKESDRIESICNMLRALGGQPQYDEYSLTVFPSAFTGGMVDCCNDHRIAMAAAIAATISSSEVRLMGADCVEKSYPSFWEDYKLLGGQYEQYIR